MSRSTPSPVTSDANLNHLFLLTDLIDTKCVHHISCSLLFMSSIGVSFGQGSRAQLASFAFEAMVQADPYCEIICRALIVRRGLEFDEGRVCFNFDSRHDQLAQFCSHFHVICWKHALDASQFTLPPIVCTFGLFQDFDLVSSPED